MNCVPLFTASFGLGAGSPAIDIGDNSQITGLTLPGFPFGSSIAVDLDNQPRFNGTVDSGAFERQ